MRIVSLEDDEPFWTLLKDALEDAFPRPNLDWIHTESEFYNNFRKFVVDPPDIFLIDIMVKWADPIENMATPPQEVVEQGYYRAGLRCRKLLLENSATKLIPVILFTVLERSDIENVVHEFPANTTFVGKSGDFRELITAIKELATHSRRISKPRVV